MILHNYKIDNNKFNQILKNKFKIYKLDKIYNKY